MADNLITWNCYMLVHRTPFSFFLFLTSVYRNNGNTLNLFLLQNDSSEDEEYPELEAIVSQVVGVLDKEKKKPAWEDDDDENIRWVGVMLDGQKSYNWPLNI